MVKNGASIRNLEPINVIDTHPYVKSNSLIEEEPKSNTNNFNFVTMSNETTNVVYDPYYPDIVKINDLSDYITKLNFSIKDEKRSKVAVVYNTNIDNLTQHPPTFLKKYFNQKNPYFINTTYQKNINEIIMINYIDDAPFLPAMKSAFPNFESDTGNRCRVEISGSSDTRTLSEIKKLEFTGKFNANKLIPKESLDYFKDQDQTTTSNQNLFLFTFFQFYYKNADKSDGRVELQLWPYCSTSHNDIPKDDDVGKFPTSTDELDKFYIRIRGDNGDIKINNNDNNGYPIITDFEFTTKVNDQNFIEFKNIPTVQLKQGVSDIYLKSGIYGQFDCEEIFKNAKNDILLTLEYKKQYLNILK